MSVTIKDIAKVGGVSHTTVSRALRGHPAISEETAGRIRQIADELGYVPNTVARGLKTNRSGALGVIVRRIVDPYFSEVLSGIEDTLYAEGYSLFLAASNRDPEREEAIVRAMSERRVDGVIICSTQVGAAHRQQLERFGVPTVLINNQAAEDITHSVYHDDAFGSSQLTEHLLNLGHTRIAYLGNKRGGRTSDERRHGYKQALLKQGLTAQSELIVDGPNGLAEGGATGAHQLLDMEERPTGIVCYNDVMAIGAMQALQEAGLSIPFDCSVTGFDNIELAAFTNPALTTFDQPKYDIGRQAALMMLRLLDKQGDETWKLSSDILTLRGQLIRRNSTAPLIREVRSVTY